MNLGFFLIIQQFTRWTHTKSDSVNFGAVLAT